MKGQVRTEGDKFACVARTSMFGYERDDPLRIRFGFDGVEHIQICDPVSWEILDELDEFGCIKRVLHGLPERFEEALEILNGIE